MLDSLLDATRPLLNGASLDNGKIRSFRVIREIAHHGVTHAMPTRDAHGFRDSDAAAARLDIEVEDEKLTAFLIADETSPVTETRGDYEAGDYVAAYDPGEDQSYEVRPQNVETRIDLMRAIIEAMRQIELRERGDTIATQRWGYITDFPLISDEVSSLAGGFSISASKFVKAEGAKRFSIRNIMLNGYDGKLPQMCFFVELKNA